MRFSPKLFLIVFILILLGCSGGRSNPVVPDDPDIAPQNLTAASDEGQETQAGASSYHSPWGTYRLHFNRDENSIEVVPDRQLLDHFDVTGFLKPPACSDCLLLKIEEWDLSECLIIMRAQLKNPFPIITGYDIRLIMDAEVEGYGLGNADGYTEFWDVWGEWRNPFVAFAKDEPLRAFGPGATHERLIEFRYPEDELDLSDVLITIDASHPENCAEPYEITNFSQEIILDMVGSTGNVQVDVFDWQDDVSEVLLSAPEITGEEFTQLDHLGGATWGAELVNNTGAVSGEYEIELIAKSTGSGTVALYQYFVLTVSESPTPVAVATAIPNPQWQGHVVDFSAEDSYDPLGLEITKYEWDWDNDGTYDEEGETVANVWEVAGIYYVQLRVTNEIGNTDELDEPLEILIEWHVDDLDMWEQTTQIVGPEGGELAISKGKMIIPPGALTEQHEFSIAYSPDSTGGYVFKYQPSGFEYEVPITLEIYPDGAGPWNVEDWDFIYYSPAIENPDGDPLSYHFRQFEEGDIESIEDGFRINSNCNCFFFIYPRDDSTRELVFNIPLEHLEPGDVLNRLTDFFGINRWHPGHTGIVGPDEWIYHAHKSTPGAMTKSNMEGFEGNDQTIYLGAVRRPDNWTEWSANLPLTAAWIGKDAFDNNVFNTYTIFLKNEGEVHCSAFATYCYTGMQPEDQYSNWFWKPWVYKAPLLPIEWFKEWPSVSEITLDLDNPADEADFSIPIYIVAPALVLGYTTYPVVIDAEPAQPPPCEDWEYYTWDAGTGVLEIRPSQLPGDDTYTWDFIGSGGFEDIQATLTIHASNVPEIKVPDPPSDLVASQADWSDCVLLEWPEAEDTDEYKIYRSNETDPNLLYYIDTTAELYYPDFSAESWHHYMYIVTSVNECGESETWSPVREGWRGGTPCVIDVHFWVATSEAWDSEGFEEPCDNVPPGWGNSIAFWQLDRANDFWNKYGIVLESGDDEVLCMYMPSPFDPDPPPDYEMPFYDIDGLGEALYMRDEWSPGDYALNVYYVNSIIDDEGQAVDSWTFWPTTVTHLADHSTYTVAIVMGPGSWGQECALAHACGIAFGALMDTKWLFDPPHDCDWLKTNLPLYKRYLFCDDDQTEDNNLMNLTPGAPINSKILSFFQANHIIGFNEDYSFNWCWW